MTITQKMFTGFLQNCNRFYTTFLRKVRSFRAQKFWVVVALLEGQFLVIIKKKTIKSA